MPATGSSRRRLIGVGLAFAIGAGAAFIASGLLLVVAGRGVWPFSLLLDLLTEDSYQALALYVTSLLAGAVVHTPLALLRRQRLRRGWLVTAVLLAYAVPVATLAHLLSGLTSPYGYGTSGLGGVLIGTATWGYSLLALSGAIFADRPVGRADAPSGSTGRDDGPLALTELLGVTTVISWLIAAPIMALMLVGAAWRALLEPRNEAEPWVVVVLAVLAGFGLARVVIRWSRRQKQKARLEDRVDVVEVLATAVQPLAGPIQNPGARTTIRCRFGDGTERSFDRLDHGPLDSSYPVAARLSVRWNPGTGLLVGEPGPAAVPGTAGRAPDVGQYVGRIGPAATDSDLLVHLPEHTLSFSPAELAVDRAAALQAGWGLVRYDRATGRLSQVIPFDPPRPAPGL